MENAHRDDLAPVEFVRATAEWVDACLLEVGAIRIGGKSVATAPSGG
jgi:hypothetical protein